ncbi:MAG TPA: 7-cyano-7-deazaguanine synthase QueC [Bacteroidota bacterium]|nr:7-cyano-7-deazaguanine synthase QueC [Bacteroidota bacterium]
MSGTHRAVALLSGGLDSVTAASIARKDGYEVYALTFNYGQRHTWEIASAKKVAAQLKAKEHKIINIDLTAFGGSALTSDLPVPKDRTLETMSAEIPATYVPARNTIFLSIALGWAEVLGAADIFIGVNAVDYSGYPDCRPEFIRAFETLANLATKAGVQGSAKYRIHAPLIAMSKAEIIRTGVGLGVDYSMTHTCYDPSPLGESCGVCDACTLRLKGFEEAGLVDPIPYVSHR